MTTSSVDMGVLTTQFGMLDWLIIGLYLSISLIIGFKAKSYISSMTDFIGAGRAVGTALGVATMAGTEMGLITIMYSAQKGFTGGFASFHIGLVAMIITFFVGFSGFIVYRLRELKVLTIPEFYEIRFGKRVRVLGGTLLAIGGILNMGLFLKVGAMFITGITGLSENSIALPVIMFTLLALVILYTCLGGMLSVIITDYIQFCVLSIGLIGVCIGCIFYLDWNTLFNTVAIHMGDAGFNPFSAEGTFGWKYVIWMCFTAGLVSCAIWPTAVARALAMESPSAVKKQYMFSSLSFMARFMIPNFLGICAFVFMITKAPDLKTLFLGSSAEINNLYALPVFLGKILPTGIIGLITAAMIAAFMSTHDSYLLCWSSVITQDVISPLRKTPLTVKQKLFSTRLCIILIGGYILYWGLFYTGTEDIWDYLAVSGAIYFTGAFALLAGGLYWKRASSTGAVLALLTGFTALLGLEPVKLFFKLGYFSGTEIGLGTVILTLMALTIGSIVFPDTKDNLLVASK